MHSVYTCINDVIIYFLFVLYITVCVSVIVSLLCTLLIYQLTIERVVHNRGVYKKTDSFQHAHVIVTVIFVGLKMPSEQVGVYSVYTKVQCCHFQKFSL